MASGSRYKKLTQKERDVYFINKILQSCPWEFKKSCVDGSWQKRHKNGKGQWENVVFSENSGITDRGSLY